MRIHTSICRPIASTLSLFAELSTANISDATSRLFSMDAGISPIGRTKRVLGTALTVKSAIADNFMFHKALSIAQPGDVIVVNACGDFNYSVCGDVMYRYAMKRGVVGFIVDGCIRDSDFLQNSDFAVFARGVTPRGPYKIPVGEINTDIACGGQVIHPGDIVIGDSDGVVVVRKDDAEAVYNMTQLVLEKEELMSSLIENGEWEEKSPLYLEINEMIRKKGFEVID